MEKYDLKTDIEVMYVPATSFPDGIPGAFDQLSARLPADTPHTLFGISWGNGDEGVIYMAAAGETYPGEAHNHGLRQFTFRKGVYATQLVTDYRSNIRGINDCFRELLQHPEIDPEGYCVEWYRDDRDVLCMVKLTH